MADSAIDKSRFRDLDRWNSTPKDVRSAASQALIQDIQTQASVGTDIVHNILDWTGSTQAGGKRTMLIHRMGDRYEKVVRDRMGEHIVASTEMDSHTRRLKNTKIFGVPLGQVQPEDVAAAWGIEFNSPLARTVPLNINKETRDAWDKIQEEKERKKQQLAEVEADQNARDRTRFAEIYNNNLTDEQRREYREASAKKKLVKMRGWLNMSQEEWDKVFEERKRKAEEKKGKKGSVAGSSNT